MPKLLEFVSEIAFDFENDFKESHLHVNILKARVQNAKNRLGMEILRENRERECSERSNLIVGNAAEMLRMHENVEQLQKMSHVFPSDWRKDVGERSSRIAQWLSKFHSDSSRTWLPNFEKAFVLVYLLRQPSSAIVERVFSQVSYIRSICGGMTNEDNLELRTQLRCNEGSISDYDY